MTGFINYWDLMRDLEHRRHELNLIRAWYKQRMELAFKKIKMLKLKNN